MEKKRFPKVISLLLMLCLLLCSIPTMASEFGDGTNTGGGSNIVPTYYSYRTPITLKKGKTVTAYILKSEKAKFKGPGKGYKWTSSNKKCISVSSSGIVTAKQKGTAVITAKKGKTVYKCKLTSEVPKWTQFTSTINLGESYQFKVINTKQKVKWASSNSSVVSITSGGKIYGKSVGYATITGKLSTMEFSTTVNVTRPYVQPTPTPKPSGETTGQRNALARAKSYLRSSSFSYESLIHQLEYEGFSNADATYAVRNCGANWNEQALKKAKSYLRSSSFSYSGLIRQLEYEKFTSEQAKYGVDNCGANWYEQAAKKAASYMRSSSFSRDRLIKQLIYEGFTVAQAEYGASAVGY